MFKVIAGRVSTMGLDRPLREIDGPAQERIATLLKEIRFSGAICIGKNGKIVSEFYTSTFNSTTQFKIGSLTKQFTAMAVMQLVENKTIKLSDTLDTFAFLKGFPHGDKITVQHLLGMNSGLPRELDLKKIDGILTEGILIENLVSHIIDQIPQEKLLFDPGSEYQYSNINYQILTYIIEKKSGIEFKEYMKDNIFKPLGMTQTSVEPLKPSGKNTHMILSLGAGNVSSSVDDIWLWEQHLEKLGQGVQGRISPKSFRDMTTPGKGNYGFGLHVEQNGYYHRGRTPGATSFFKHEKDTTYIVFSNDENENTNLIADAVELKMLDKSFPEALKYDLKLRDIRHAIRNNENERAMKIFMDFLGSMNDVLEKAEFQGTVGTNYFYHVNNNPDQVKQHELKIMITALKNALPDVPADKKPRVQGALNGLQGMRV